MTLSRTTFVTSRARRALLVCVLAALTVLGGGAAWHPAANASPAAVAEMRPASQITTAVRTAPRADAPIIGWVPATCYTIGHSPRRGNWWLVAAPRGGTGWVFNDPHAPFCH